MAKAAINLFKATSKGIPATESFTALLEWYVNEGYKADTSFRRFLTLTKQGQFSLPQVEQINNLIDSSYRCFCDRSVAIYQDYIQSGGISHGNIEKNLGVFDRLILPLLKKGKRLVMIMVDGFRFEMGMDFLSMIKSRFPKSNCDASMAYLPTVTRFGMASLLPDSASSLELKTVGGTLQPFIKEILTDTPDKRIQAIKRALGESFKVEETLLENFSP